MIEYVLEQLKAEKDVALVILGVVLAVAAVWIGAGYLKENLIALILLLIPGAVCVAAGLSLALAASPRQD